MILWRRWLAALAAGLALTGAAEPAPLRPVDVFAIELARDTQISPDGRRIAYVRTHADPMTDTRRKAIWLVGSDGTDHRRLSGDAASDASPRWSPDGRRLAYISARDGNADVYVRRLADGSEHRATDGTRAVSALAWSPDGRRLAVVMQVKGAAPKLGETTPPPAGAKWKAAPRIVDRALYRTDGGGYAEPGNQHIFVVDALGGHARQLTSGAFDHGDGLAWAPGGGELYFSANLTSGREALQNWDNTDIYRVSVATGELTRVTDRAGPDNAPALSPDGRRLAFVGYDEKLTHYEITQLSVLELATGTVSVVSRDLDRDVGPPAWSPDGRSLIATYIDAGRTRLARFALDGKVKTLATGLGSGVFAYGFDEAFSVARTGAIAMNLTDVLLPSAVGVLPPGGSRPVTLVDLNRDLLADRSLPTVEELRYTSADGAPIQGWIMRPPGFDASKRYPMILDIHGGPLGEYGFRFDFEKAVLASAGYAVLYVNPRGSSGYGHRFGNHIHHAFPGDDYADLMAGVDATIARGGIDPDRLFVMGGSAGGTLAAWITTKTKRFAGAVVLYPAISWSSMTTTDILPYIARNRMPGMPWEAPEAYARLSPISHVASVRTPTLLLTGEEDWRTPISETEQYFAALQWLGVPSTMVRFPGENHGIRRHPSNVVAKLDAIVGWLGNVPAKTTTNAD